MILIEEDLKLHIFRQVNIKPKTLRRRYNQARNLNKLPSLSVILEESMRQNIEPAYYDY